VPDLLTDACHVSTELAAQIGEDILARAESYAMLDDTARNVLIAPRTAGFLVGQQEFSAANPWFSARRLNGVTHFPALEIPDATAAEIERFLG
jgi:hypothetical protein